MSDSWLHGWPPFLPDFPIKIANPISKFRIKIYIRSCKAIQVRKKSVT